MDLARRELRRLLLARALRTLADGYVAVLLPAYLLALGHQAWAVGLISSGTLLGSALATLALGAFGHRWPVRHLLSAAALLMVITGAAFGASSGFWPLLLIAFVGTLNPSAGDVSVFLPLEHARLATLFEGDVRTRAFARYTIVGSLCAAFGALLAGLPAWLAAARQVDPLATMRAMFVLYGAVGLGVWALYRGLPSDPRPADQVESAPLGASRPVVTRLALLFSAPMCLQPLSSLLTSSAVLAAPILRISRARYTSTVRGLMARRLPISLLVRPSISSAAISRSRAVKSTFSARRDDRSSKAQMPAACGWCGSSARPLTWHQNNSPACLPPNRFITRSSA